MTIQERISTLIKTTEGPCISLIIPLAQTMPDRARNITRIQDMSKQVLAKVEQPLADALKKAIDSLDINQHASDGIAILVNKNHHEIIPLNGPCTAKSHSGTLYVLDEVIQGIQYSTNFWVLLVGQEYARLFTRDHNTLTEIITPLKDSAGKPLQGFPLTIIPPEDKFKQAAGKGDRGADYFDAEIKHFFQLVDSELQKIITTRTPMPIILCGTPEHVVLFKKTTHHPDNITLEVRHDYDAHHKSPEHLKKDIEHAVAQYNQQQGQKLLQEFEDAANTRRQACGITYVWEMASTGRVHILLLEPNLPEFGRIDPENPAHLQIFPEKSDPTINYISDVLIYETLRHGGTVHIVQPGSLQKCQGVGAIMRY